MTKQLKKDLTSFGCIDLPSSLLVHVSSIICSLQTSRAAVDTTIDLYHFIFTSSSSLSSWC